MTTQNTQPTRIGIIGAGLTGLITATLLERAFAHVPNGLHIDIFEKSAGVGRLATRYKIAQSLEQEMDTLAGNTQQHYQFDFGAPFFTAKSKDFQDFIQPWVRTGVLQPWCANIAYFGSDNSKPNTLSFDDEANIQERWDVDKPRYISVPKITSWGRALANSLSKTKLHFKTRVSPLSKKSYNNHTKMTTLLDDKGNRLGKFDWVICTVPNAQAIELFEQTSFNHLRHIQTFKMLACYSLMLGWQSAERLPKILQDAKWDVALSKSTTKNAKLDKLFIEHHKPKRDHILPSVTIHASNEWSEAHVDDDIKVVTKTLMDSVAQLCKWQAHEYPSHVDCHRWRYAFIVSQADASIPADAFVDTFHNWIVAGDWCVEGRIESCFESATAALNGMGIVKPL